MNALLCRNNLWVQVDVKDLEVDVKQIKDAIAGLKLLGKEVYKITLPMCTSCDVDTPYYRRLPEKIIDTLCDRLGGRPRDPVVILKRNRLYMEIEGKEIILPKNLEDTYKKGCLTVELCWKK